MSALLTEVLQRACESEPLPGDAVADIVVRAERLRRRRARGVVFAGVVAVVILILLGYALTTVLLPGPKPPSTAAVAVPQPRPSRVLDPVLATLAPQIDAKGYRIEPRQPGSGWRRYAVHDGAGAPRGLVEVAVFDAEAGLCLPVLANPSACALPDRTGAGVEYARYATTGDVDWQVNQVIARRVVDGRTVAVMATGERGTGSAEAGAPPLTTAEAAQAATDPHLQDAFGVGERCNRPAPACPILKFPVRPSD